MRHWAQIVDANEVNDPKTGVRTWYELWALEEKRAFMIHVRGASPLDIGHIVYFSDRDDPTSDSALQVLQFEHLPDAMQALMVVTPVSFEPARSIRPFQTEAWRREHEGDKQYSDKLRRFASSEPEGVPGGRLYNWYNHSDVLEAIS